MTRSAGEVGALTGAPRHAIVCVPLEKAGVGPHPATPGTARPGPPLPQGASARSRRWEVGAIGDGSRVMGLFDKLRGRGGRTSRGRGGGGRRATLDRGSQRTDLTHLEQFV